MPKSSKKKIDEDEREFLKILQKNSGDSIEQIAKKCGFSRQKVWRIKKRLEKSNTIWGYNAVVDDEKLGLKMFQIFLKRSSMPLSNKMVEAMLAKDMRQQLEKFGVEFNYSYFTHGNYDWSMCVSAPDITQVKRFTELISAQFPNLISEIQILEVIFPLLKGGFDNPNLSEFKEFFML